MFKVNLNLPNLALHERAMFLPQWIDNPSDLITWDDIEQCMNNPILHHLELIDPENRKLPFDRNFLAKEKRFLFDALHNDHGLVITEFGHYNEKTKKLLKFFEETFDVHCAIHVYCGLTSKATSFKIHCDSPTNFIIQVEGKCHWKIYENRMSNLIDFSCSHPEEIDERELTTVVDEILSPGDGVLIPPRQYHLAMPMERRISLSIPCWPRNRKKKPEIDRNYYRLRT